MKVSTRSRAHDQLRSSTHHLHHLVDSRFDLTSLSSEAAYSAFLLANWPFASIEAALERAGIHDVLPDWDKRRRREALAVDLRHCGISPPRISRGMLTWPTDCPQNHACAKTASLKHVTPAQES